MVDVLENEIILHKTCALDTEATRSAVYDIDSGILVKVRRWYFRLILLSEHHPKTKIFYKSLTTRISEERKHLQNYPFLIHPFSNFNIIWEMLMFFVFIYMLAVYSVDDIILHGEKNEKIINELKIVGDFIYTLDVMHFFLLGYYSYQKSRTIFNCREIAKRYLCSYFIIDVIALIPTYIILFEKDKLVGQTLGRYEVFVRYIGIIRLLRIGRWLESLDIFCSYNNMSSDLYKLCKIVMLYAIMLCGGYFFIFVVRTYVRRLQHKMKWRPVVNRYLQATYVLVIAAVRRGKKSTPFLLSVWLVSFLICAFIMYLYLFTQLLQLWSSFMTTRTTTSTIIEQVNHYMYYKGVPLELREKVYSFIKFKYQGQIYHERRMRVFVSDLKKLQILIDLCRKCFEKNFRNFPNFILFKLASKMKIEIFMPNDVIMRIGDTNNSIYFIQYGTVAVYESDDSEICHLEDGDSFGELCLLTNSPKLVKVVATAPSEILIYKKKDFHHIFKEYPEIKQRIILDLQMRFLESNAPFF